MRGKKFILSIFIALMCSLMAFSSGSSDGKSGEKDLRMLWWGGDSRHAPTLQMLEMFEEENPGVSVEGEYVGWDGYYQKIVVQLSGGTAADVLQIDQPWFNELCSLGDVFLEIDPDIVDLSGFDQAFLDMFCVYDGRLLGLPTGVNVNTLLMDKVLLREHGIDPDITWTWDTIVSEGRKLHESDPSMYFDGATPDVVKFWWEMYMAQLAGGVVDEDKNLMFTRDQAIQSFEYFKQWFDLGIVAPFAQSSLFYQKFEENPDWINGKMATGWSWTSSMEKAIGNRTVTTTTLPVMDDAVQTGVLMRPSQIFVVPKSTAYPEEAMKLLDYIFNDPEAVTVLGTCRSVPPASNARKVLSDAGLITELVETTTNNGIAQAGWPQSTWQSNSQVIQVMQDVIDEFGYGRLTPEEAADRMIDGLTAVLAKL